MKLKVNWKELARQLWAAIRPVLLGAIGGGIVSVASGCSSMAPSDKTQTMSVYALGCAILRRKKRLWRSGDATKCRQRATCMGGQYRPQR